MQYIRSGIREVYDVLWVISTDMDHRRCHTSRMLDDLMWWKLRGTEQQSGRDCSWVFLFCTFLRVEQHQPLSMWAPCSRTPTHEAWSGRPVRWTITQMNWRTTKRRKTTWKPKPVHPAPVRRLVPPLVPPRETTPAPTRVEGTSCSTWASASSPGAYPPTFNMEIAMERIYIFGAMQHPSHPLMKSLILWMISFFKGVLLHLNKCAIVCCPKDCSTDYGVFFLPALVNKQVHRESFFKDLLLLTWRCISVETSTNQVHWICKLKVTS